MCLGKTEWEKPEVLLASEFQKELGVEINPQALRMFIRSRWWKISGLAHSIHGAPNQSDPEHKQAQEQGC